VNLLEKPISILQLSDDWSEKVSYRLLEMPTDGGFMALTQSNYFKNITGVGPIQVEHDRYQ
jgi:hypothetical protein